MWCHKRIYLIVKEKIDIYEKNVLSKVNLGKNSASKASDLSLNGMLSKGYEYGEGKVSEVSCSVCLVKDDSIFIINLNPKPNSLAPVAWW